MGSHGQSLQRSESKEGLNPESISDRRCCWYKGPEEETNLASSRIRKKVTVEFGKPWEHDLKQMGLVKGRNLNMEFGLYSERSKKLLEDFTEG